MRRNANMSEPCVNEKRIRQLEDSYHGLDKAVAVAQSDLSNVKGDMSEIKATIKDMDRKMTDNFGKLQERQDSDRKWKVGLMITSGIAVIGILASIFIK